MKYPCPACNGNGKIMIIIDGDEEYIRCWECCGNGTDNAKYFYELIDHRNKQDYGR